MSDGSVGLNLAIAQAERAAFRRGAEAMRETAIKMLDEYPAGHGVISITATRERLRVLPLPEPST